MLGAAELEERTLDEEVGDWLSLRTNAPADRWRLYDRLRREAPVLVRGTEVYISRYADCVAVLRDNKAFLSGFDLEDTQIEAALQRLDPESKQKYREILQHQLRWMTSSNGAKHVSLRTLVTRVFSARAIEDMRHRIRSEVDTRLDALSTRQSIELISDIAYQLPLTIISEMLDIPVDVRESIHTSWQSMTKLFGQPPERVEEVIDVAHQGMVELEQRLKRTMDSRRGGDTTDLLSRLLSAQEDSGGDVSEREIIGIVSQMVIAGHQTTQDTLGNGLFELFRNRDSWRAVCADPLLIPNAVEEILRFQSPAQMMTRTARTDCTIGGQPVSAGARIVCLLGAANRDEAMFVQADRFDIHRPNASQHLAFSSGVHFCLGASLSRMEARTFFEVFSQRFPDADLADEPVEWIASLLLHGVKALHVNLR